MSGESAKRPLRIQNIGAYRPAGRSMDDSGMEIPPIFPLMEVT